MQQRMRAVPFASLPFLFAGLLVAAWHFGVYGALFPLSLLTLLFPASFGYAGVILLAPSEQQRKTPHLSALTMATSVFTTLLAYASSLYGIGSVLQLIPEVYKFGSSVVSLSHSTVLLWAGLTASSGAIAAAGLKLAASSPVAQQLFGATLGMVVGSVAVFVPLLASNHVVVR